MPAAIHYDVDGIADIEHRLLGIGARAIETRPVLEMFSRQLEEMMADTFAAEGYGRWPPLSAATVAKKGSSTILRETDALMDSLTQEGSEGAIREIFGDELIFGTHLTSEEGFPYPVAHRTGTSRMPARDPLIVRDMDLRRFTRVLHQYLMGLDRQDFGVGSWSMSSFDPFGL